MYLREEAEKHVHKWLIVKEALSLATIEADFGPHSRYSNVLKSGIIREFNTVYGKVWSLSTAERTRINQIRRVEYEKQLTKLENEEKTNPRWPSRLPPPLITMVERPSPGKVADRAYLNDAIYLLEASGYRFASLEYKRGKTGGTLIDAPLHARLWVPQPHLEHLRATYDAPSHNDFNLTLPIGQPILHAHLSGGGLSPADLRRKVTKQPSEYTETHHPIIAVVPDRTRFAAIERKEQAHGGTYMRHVMLLELRPPPTITRHAR